MLIQFSRLLAALVLVAGPFAVAGPRTNADELSASRVCASRAPVLVIDTFSGEPSNERNIDLDGDGAYDVHHGEFVSKLVELNGQPVTRVVIPTPVFSPQLLDVLTATADGLERGDLKVSWINFSQGFTVEIESLNGLLGLKNKVTEKNVHQYGRQVLETLWSTRPKLKLRELHDAFLRLERLGVPVVVAAANSGFREVNIYSLFPNVLSVGALDLDGRKAGYSADNSTVTLWRQGTIKSYRVGGGLDFNGDGRADEALLTPWVSGKLLASFSGKRAAEVAMPVPADIDRANDDGRTEFLQLVAKLPVGLYSTEEILRKSLATPFQQKRYVSGLGEYFYLDGKRPLPLFFMGIDNSGVLRLKQGAMKGEAQFRNLLYGTSFASPNLCDGEKTPEQFAL